MTTLPAEPTKTAAKTEEGLNLQQEAFCQLYVNGERELFGNGTQCYLEIYGKEYYRTHRKEMSYDVARALASRLLTKANVVARVNGLLESGGFSDENVDKQHLFLINQHADLKSKLGAIKEYNALKRRVDPKLPPGGNTFNIVVFNDQQASKIARRIIGAVSVRNQPSETAPD